MTHTINFTGLLSQNTSHHNCCSRCTTAQAKVHCSMASDLPGVRDWVAAAGLVSFPLSAQFVGCQGPESQTDGGCAAETPMYLSGCTPRFGSAHACILGVSVRPASHQQGCLPLAFYHCFITTASCGLVWIEYTQLGLKIVYCSI